MGERRGVVGWTKLLIWNTILGLLVFLLANEAFDFGIPYASWPILLAVVFGIPGALAAILLWVLVA